MPFVVQNISIGVAVIQDRSRNPVFPRWVAYFTSGSPHCFSPRIPDVLQNRPLAYNGVLAFWIQ